RCMSTGAWGLLAAGIFPAHAIKPAAAPPGPRGPGSPAAKKDQKRRGAHRLIGNNYLSAERPRPPRPVHAAPGAPRQKTKKTRRARDGLPSTTAHRSLRAAH